jgi:hypothetical protein
VKKFAKVISSGLSRQLNIIRIFSSKSEVLKVGTTSDEFYQAKAVEDNKGYFFSKEPASVY